MGKYFGTDGIRGLANVHPMTPLIAMKLGMAIGKYFAGKGNVRMPSVLIGKDTRISCYSLEQALASGITAMGVNVLFTGPIPTPGIAYLTRGMRATAGVVISASHNPYHDNGIKIFSHEGYKLLDQIETELEELIDSDDLILDLKTHEKIGRAKRIDDAIGQYAVFLKESFPKDLTLDGIRIVVDCANGASYKAAPKVFSELGAEIFVLGNEPNGMNINDNCGALHPEHMQEKVRRYKADIGIALDGDADRLIVCDEKGEIIDGDRLLAICGCYLKEEGKLANDTIVTTVMSNIGLDIAMKEKGIDVQRTKVGDRYVVEWMREHGFNLGGEQSGHIVFLDTNPTGDGVLSALKLLEIMIKKRKPLSKLKEVMETVPQILINVPVNEKRPIDEVAPLADKVKEVESKLEGKGRVLLRYSGTENLLRIMVEGTDESYIKTEAHNMAALAKEHL